MPFFRFPLVPTDIALLPQLHRSSLDCAIAALLQGGDGTDAEGRGHVPQADVPTHHVLELAADPPWG